MVICAQCRHDNPEDGKFCVNCGRTLAPEHVRLSRPAERDEKELDELDVSPPVRRSPIAAILGVVLIGVAASAFFMFQETAPDPCRGKFSSALYPYCLEVPAGWRVTDGILTTGDADLFETPTEDASITVRADILNPQTTITDFAQQFRHGQEAVGLIPGELRLRTLDEDQALTWNLQLPLDEGTLRQRYVVTVKEGQGWAVRFVTMSEQYELQLLQFERMLQTWTWA